MAARFRSLLGESWFWPVIGSWMSLFVLGLVDNTRGPVFPDLLREFHLTDTTGSYFFLAASIAEMVHNTIFFRFLSKASPRKLVGLYTLVMGIGALLISHVTQYEWTLVACAILGIGFGGMGVGQNAAVQMAPPQHRQRAMGMLHTMYGLSSFTAPLLISYLAMHGWRISLAILALPSVFVAAFVIFEAIWAARREKRKVGPSTSRVGAAAEVTDDTRATRNLKPAKETVPLVVVETVTASSPKVKPYAAWCAAALIGLFVVSEVSISSRISLLARREWGLSLDQAAMYLALYFVAMTASRLLIGLFKFPFSAKQLLYFAFIMGFPCLFLGFMPLGFSTEVRLLCLVVFGFPIAMGYPLAMTRIAEIFGVGTQRVTSLCLIFQSSGGVIMHFSLGWGADHSGLLFALGTAAIVSLLGAFASFWSLERAVLR